LRLGSRVIAAQAQMMQLLQSQVQQLLQLGCKAVIWQKSVSLARGCCFVFIAMLVWDVAATSNSRPDIFGTLALQLRVLDRHICQLLGAG
jgi:hypothetical protein